MRGPTWWSVCQLLQTRVSSARLATIAVWLPLIRLTVRLRCVLLSWITCSSCCGCPRPWYPSQNQQLQEHTHSWDWMRLSIFPRCRFFYWRCGLLLHGLWYPNYIKDCLHHKLSIIVTSDEYVTVVEVWSDVAYTLGMVLELLCKSDLPSLFVGFVKVPH